MSLQSQIDRAVDARRSLREIEAAIERLPVSADAKATLWLRARLRARKLKAPPGGRAGVEGRALGSRPGD